MRLGVDLRPLQMGHKYRGIGEVAKQTADRLLLRWAANGIEPVVFQYSDVAPATELLTLPPGLRYDTVEMVPDARLPGRPLSSSERATIEYRAFAGDPVPEARGRVDAFLQYDYSMGVPTHVPTVLVKHDIIPWVLKRQYFVSPWDTFRKRWARTTLRTIYRNSRQNRLVRRSLTDATRIVVPSASTAADLHRHFGIPDAKMAVVPWGVDLAPTRTNDVDRTPRDVTGPYLLWVGSVDPRRRVEDLLGAYNNLRADGEQLQVVLVGENFRTRTDVPNPAVQRELDTSAYGDGIITAGYVDDETKQALFQGALAFVNPTTYEGFGLSVLEAMALGCPVVTYRNSSLPEVGGDVALYVDDWEGIMDVVRDLLHQPAGERARLVEAGRSWAARFTWEATTATLHRELMAIARH